MSRPVLLARRIILRDGSDILDGAVVVPDASFLLMLYEAAPDEREALLTALNALKHRIWVANRTRREVLRRLPIVRSRNRVVIPHALKAHADFCEKLSKDLSGRGDIYPSFGIAIALQKALERGEFTKHLLSEFYTLEASAFAAPDRLLGEILKDDFVGNELRPDEVERVLRCGVNRIVSGIPPGCGDVHKLGNRSLEDALGDVIFWEEVLRFACDRRRSIILVTAEEKDDWWLRDAYGKSSPHPLLIKEMLERTGQQVTILRPRELVAVIMYRQHAEEMIQSERTFMDLQQALAPPGGARSAQMQWMMEQWTGLVSPTTQAIVDQFVGPLVIKQSAEMKRMMEQWTGLVSPATQAMVGQFVNPLVIKQGAEIQRMMEQWTGIVSPTTQAMVDQLINPLVIKQGAEMQRMMDQWAGIVSPTAQAMVDQFVGPLGIKQGAEMRRMMEQWAGIVSPTAQAMVDQFVGPLVIKQGAEMQRMMEQWAGHVSPTTQGIVDQILGPLGITRSDAAQRMLAQPEEPEPRDFGRNAIRRQKRRKARLEGICTACFIQRSSRRADGKEMATCDLCRAKRKAR